MIQQGTYEATLLGYGILKTSKGDPAPSMKFLIKDDQGGPHNVFWQGSFKSEASQKIAVQALITCGLKAVEDIPKMAGNVESGVLDTSKKVSVTVKHEYDEKDPTKVYPKVEWVNPLGEMGGKREYVAPAEASRLMASINLRQAWNVATQGKTQSPSQPVPPSHDDGDQPPLPF